MVATDIAKYSTHLYITNETNEKPYVFFDIFEIHQWFFCVFHLQTKKSAASLYSETALLIISEG